jgi:hypothetical protein
MAGKTDTSATLFAQKKLLGKAHTSNLKIDGEEVIGSNIQAATNVIFGDRIPGNPSQTLYTVQGVGATYPSVEYIEFELIPIEGTTYDANNPGGGGGSDTGEGSQTAGPHAYMFRFPSNYQTLTNNTKSGNGVFDNLKYLHETLGQAQLIPPFFSQNAPNPYIVKLYKDDGSGSAGAEIPLLDNIDWNVDYYNGILFIQDYSANKVPAFARAFVYVGRMSNEVIDAAANQGPTTYGTNVLIKTSWMEIPEGDVSLGANMVFDLDEKPEPLSALLLYVNGVLQKQGYSEDYTISNKQIVFNYAPRSNSNIFATYPYLYFLPTTTKWVDIPSGLTNGVNYTFELSETPTPPEALMLYVDGVLQRQGVIGDYTIAGKIITMNYIPKVGSNLSATYPF